MIDEGTIPGRLNRQSYALGPNLSVPDWWESLYEATPRRSIFLGKDWVQTWLKIYGQKFDGSWICWTGENNIVVGGCLIAWRKSGIAHASLRSIYINATGTTHERTPLAEFNEILHVPGYENVIALDLAAHLDSLPWLRLFVSGYEADTVLCRLVETYAPAVTVEHAIPAPYIDLLSLGESSFDAQLSSNTRSQVRRSRKMYEALFGPLKINRAKSLEEAQEFMAALARLHNIRRKSKGDQGAFTSPQIVEFHKRLINRLWVTNGVDLIRCSAGESDIGYLYNFLDNGKVCFFQSGLVYGVDSRLKPGLISHSLAIEYYRSVGAGEYDFLAGAAQYKNSLCHQQRSLRWAKIYRNHLGIRILILIRAQWRKVFPA